MMSFNPPVSTSNLYPPTLDRVWQHFVDGRSSGDMVNRLERALEVYHESDHCVVFSTGFWALVAGVYLRGIEGRREVIIPSLTYRRLADVVFWAGFEPVFVDVDERTLAICPDAVREMISNDTALILGVHPIVNCCLVLELIEIGHEFQIPVLFDAVESVHETYGGRRVGAFGVGEVFSFHASKLINGCEGGYVCTNDKVFRDQLRAFRQQQAEPGRLSIQGEMNLAHAAMALASLEEIDQVVSHNKMIYEAYRQWLNDIVGIELLHFDEDEQTSYKNIVVELTSEFPMNRDQLVRKLNREGVLARAYYDPPLHRKQYRYPVRVGQMLQTERLENRFLNLPCGWRVAYQDVVTLCDRLRELSKQYGAENKSSDR